MSKMNDIYVELTIFLSYLWGYDQSILAIITEVCYNSNEFEDQPFKGRKYSHADNENFTSIHRGDAGPFDGRTLLAYGV